MKDKVASKIIKSVTKSKMQSEALDEVLLYILETERGNYENYCEENNLNPKKYYEKRQKCHIYALTLIAYGLNYNEERL